MFVNCSHGKGIKFIRDELKFFAKTNIQLNANVTFKTIVLLNADCLTIDAQSALRRCIELFSCNTRFFIIVENKHKLLNPILSRFCEIFIPEIYSTSLFSQRYNTDKAEKLLQISENKITTSSGLFKNLHQYKLNYTMNNKIYHDKRIAQLHLILNEIICIVHNHSNNIEVIPITRVNTSTIKNNLIYGLICKIYTSGFSCLDLMNYLDYNINDFAKIIEINKIDDFETTPYEFSLHKKSDKIYNNFSRERFPLYIMEFSRIKSEFRCEKILMLYMFSFMGLWNVNKINKS